MAKILKLRVLEDIDVGKKGEIINMTEKASLHYLDRGLVERVEEGANDKTDKEYLEEMKIAVNEYQKLGYSIIPFNRDKTPGIKEWKPYQKRKPTDKELAQWFSKPTNIAVVCGKISGFCSIDFDDYEIFKEVFPEGEDKLAKETRVNETGRTDSKGLQVCFIPKDGDFSTKRWLDVRTKDKEVKIEICGTGKLAIVPPSIHSSGKRYSTLRTTKIATLDRKKLVARIEEVLCRIGYLKSKSKPKETKVVDGGEWKKKIEDCGALTAILDMDHPTHELRIFLAMALKNGIKIPNAETTIQYLIKRVKWSDADKNEMEKGIKSIFDKEDYSTPPKKEHFKEWCESCKSKCVIYKKSECIYVDDATVLSDKLLGNTTTLVSPYQFVCDDKLYHGFQSRKPKTYTDGDAEKNYYPIYLLNSDFELFVTDHFRNIVPKIGNVKLQYVPRIENRSNVDVNFLGFLQGNKDVLKVGVCTPYVPTQPTYLHCLKEEDFQKNQWWESLSPNNGGMTLENLFLLAKNILMKDVWFKKPVLYDITNLYCFMTHCYELFDHIPYKKIGGATLYGKTRLLYYDLAVCFRARLAADPSALHRIIDQQKGTMLFDELDDLANPRSPNRGKIREIILVGNKRSGCVPRQERTPYGKYITRDFSVYGPKIFATASDYDEMIINRGIEIVMNRKTMKLDRDVDPDPTKPPWQGLRSLFTGFALKAAPNVAKAFREYSFDSMFLTNRDIQNFKPLFAIAKVVSPDMEASLETFAENYIKDRLNKKSEDAEYGLVYVLWQNFGESVKNTTENNKKAITLKAPEIEEMYRNYLGDPRTEFVGERKMMRRVDNEWLNPTWIGRALRRINLDFTKPRSAGGFKYTFTIGALREVAESYQIVDKEGKMLLDFGKEKTGIDQEIVRAIIQIIKKIINKGDIVTEEKVLDACILSQNLPKEETKKSLDWLMGEHYVYEMGESGLFLNVDKLDTWMNEEEKK